MKYIFYYHTDIGKIGIAETGAEITNLFFETDLRPADYSVQETPLLRDAAQQLAEYLLGKRQAFSLPLAPQGTPFMKDVWNCLGNIPYGTTQSYQGVAKAVGNANACRAVGLANNRNPIPIFIPCHRVIGANGQLIGYRGGLECKAYLLELEKKHKKL